MSLKDRLMEDLKSAMREKDKRRKDTITLIRAAIKQREVDDRCELSDKEILGIINKQFKEKKSSIEEFKKANRDDLVTQTAEEMDILLEYMPEQLSEEELRQIVKQAIEENNFSSMKDMGQIMKIVMPKVAGRADGGEVNRIAKDLLN